MKFFKFTAAALVAVACAGPTIANDGTPVLHPLEAVCIDYEMSGQMQNGSSTKCHRDFGYEQYEIQNITIGIAGFTQSQNQHTITIGDQIYAINLQTNTGTQTTNPIYAGLVDALQNTTPDQMGATFVSAMGYTPTGATKTIANTECIIYSAQQMGTMCMTSDGLLLEQDVMGMTQTATSVSIGSAGDDANYTLYQNVPITQGPDLSNGLGGLLPQMQGN